MDFSAILCYYVLMHTDTNSPLLRGVALPDAYVASDKTIQVVHDLPRAGLVDVPVKPHVSHGSSGRNGEVTTITIDPRVMTEARKLARGDLGRITLQHDGSVLVR